MEDIIKMDPKEFNWLQVVTTYDIMWTQQWIQGFHNRPEMSWPAKRSSHF